MLYKRLFPNVTIQGATPLLFKAIYSRIIAVLWTEHAAWDTYIDVNIVSCDKMKFISYLTRGIPKPTDVLTFSERNKVNRRINDILFPSIEYTYPAVSADFSVRRTIRDESIDLGSIYVCVEYIWHSIIHRSLKNLPPDLYLEAALVHALLHALGYTHQSDETLRQMIRREKYFGYYLQSLHRRYPQDMPSFDIIEYIKTISCA